MKSSNISTKVSDDMLNLQRKRIQANLAQSDELLKKVMDMPTWEVVAGFIRDGLVITADTVKTLSILIHDMEKHRVPFSACPDALCKVNNETINHAIKLIVKMSELEPKEADHGR